jgi:hypothetical protein
MGNQQSATTPDDGCPHTLRRRDALEDTVLENLHREARFDPLDDDIDAGIDLDRRRTAAARRLQRGARRWLSRRIIDLCRAHDLDWTYYCDDTTGVWSPLDMHHDVSWQIWGHRKKRDEFEDDDSDMFGIWSL